MFIIKEQPVHHDVLISGDQIDTSQLPKLKNSQYVVIDVLIDGDQTYMNQIESLAQNENSTDDNKSTIVGPPVDKSYTVQDTSVSEVEVPL